MATAKELSRRGMNIFGVHFDRKAAMKQINEDIEEMKSNGVEVEFFNMNAADEDKRAQTIDTIKEKMGDQPLKALIHSLAFGTLRVYFGETPEDEITQSQMDMTCNVMAHSLVYWSRDLYRQKLLARGSRIYAMTSAGRTYLLAQLWSGFSRPKPRSNRIFDKSPSNYRAKASAPTQSAPV
jgi:enoyl-[acyl-carrier protein] reductase III